MYCEDLAGPAINELDFGSFQRSLRVGQMYTGSVKSTQVMLMSRQSWEFTHCSCTRFPYSTDGKHFGRRDRAVCRECLSMPLGLVRERNHPQMAFRLVSTLCVSQEKCGDQMDIWILYNFHVSQSSNYYYCCFSHLWFKNTIFFLSLWAIPNRHRPDLPNKPEAFSFHPPLCLAGVPIKISLLQLAFP